MTSNVDIHKYEVQRKKLLLHIIKSKKRLLFLKQCKSLDYIPMGLRIKQHYHFPGSNNLYKGFNRDVLESTITSTIENVESLRSELAKITSELEKMGPLPPSSFKATRQLATTISRRHSKKINRFFYSSPSPESPENQYCMTSIELPNQMTPKQLCNKREDTLLRRVRVQASIRFLEDCISRQFIPNSIRIRRSHRLMISNQLYDKFNRTLCLAIIDAKKKYANRMNDFLQNIDKTLNDEGNLLRPWCTDNCNGVKYLKDKLDAKYKQKLSKLPTHNTSSVDAEKSNTTEYNSIKQSNSSTTDGIVQQDTSVNNNSLTGANLPPTTTNDDESSSSNGSTLPPLVYNFSSRKLEKSEISLLLKGLGFSPIEPSNHFQVACSVRDFTRSVRLAIIHEYSEKPKPKFFVKSQFIPTVCKDDKVEAYLNELEKKSDESIPKQFTQHNLTWAEKQSLKSLRCDSSIVMKSADKSQAFVIMDKGYYSAKVKAMLSDGNYYIPYGKNKYHYRETVKKVIILAKRFNLDDNIKRYICDYDIQTPLFYALPKLHKSKRIDNLLKEQNSSSRVLEMNDDPPDDLPFRPIVASTNGPTQQLSRLLDGLLRPYLCKVQSYIESYEDFLDKISSHRKVTSNTLLCTFDIKDLYTNIDHALTVKAIRYWIKSDPALLETAAKNVYMSIVECKKFIIEALEIILDNNIFMFDGTYYKQIKGIAMGSSIAPTIANLTIGYLEINLYEKVKERMGEDIHLYIKEHWYRYIDDCQLLWPFGNENLAVFTNILNELNEAIKFVREENTQKLPFLNIMLYIENNQLEFDIYYKPTHTFAYINFRSAHPRHVKRMLPYTLASMIKKIVTNDERYRRRIADMRNHLISRGYPSRLIDDAINKMKNENSKEAPTSPSIRFLNFRVVYNPNNPDLYSDVSTQLPIALGERASKFRIRKVNKQSASLKRILTSNKFYHEPQPPSNGPKACQQRGCKMCERIIDTPIDENIRWNATLDCHSRFVVYEKSCKHCKKHSINHIDSLFKDKTPCDCGNANTQIFPFHKMNTNNPVDREVWFNMFRSGKVRK
ncbi:unnamed protein product [Rotaria magnacalcarata]|uniref:Reverse transcriptase domain-containing protein n=2 Tax=Rotaria magnacalcarata TaxID=392030 RepID=A0A8S2QA61_9BILA|nr:unnamed protein product [Rotaria magnacalcarata]